MKETALNIKWYGQSVLRKKARPVAYVDDSHRVLLSQMARVMYESGGIGLAAPQVGVSERMIVVDAGQGLFKLVNPVIRDAKGRQITEEGCLSLPGICIKVKRANSVTVHALDEAGKKVAVKAEGLLACVFQHEIDHLKGKLIVDYASFIDRIRIKGRLKELKRKAQHEGMPESETKLCELQL